MLNVLKSTWDKVSTATSLPREFWEEDVGVPSKPCSCLASMFEGWFGWEMVPDSKDCDSDWERELSGEVESDDEELNEDERARDPGMLTGADPPSTLWPKGKRRVRELAAIWSNSQQIA